MGLSDDICVVAELASRMVARMRRLDYGEDHYAFVAARVAGATR